MRIQIVSSPEYMTQSEVARALGLGITTVRKLVRKGELVERRSYPGVQARYHADDVAAFKARYEQPAAQTQTA